MIERLASSRNDTPESHEERRSALARKVRMAIESLKTSYELDGWQETSDAYERALAHYTDLMRECVEFFKDEGGWERHDSVVQGHFLAPKSTLRLKRAIPGHTFVVSMYQLPDAKGLSPESRGMKTYRAFFEEESAEDRGEVREQRSQTEGQARELRNYGLGLAQRRDGTFEPEPHWPGPELVAKAKESGGEAETVILESKQRFAESISKLIERIPPTLSPLVVEHLR